MKPQMQIHTFFFFQSNQIPVSYWTVYVDIVKASGASEGCWSKWRRYTMEDKIVCLVELCAEYDVLPAHGTRDACVSLSPQLPGVLRDDSLYIHPSC